MNLREAAEKALEAFTGLLTFNPTHNEYAKGREAVAALRGLIGAAGPQHPGGLSGGRAEGRPAERGREGEGSAGGTGS